MTVKNDTKKTEIYSLYSVFLIGRKWKQDVELWPRPDWGNFKFDDVKDNSKFTPEEETFLAGEWKKQIFKNRDLHQSIQRHFLELLRVAVQELQDVCRRMEGVFRIQFKFSDALF